MKFLHPPTNAMVNAGLFVLRLTLFTIFIVHGSQKMLGWFGGHGFQATVTGFTHGMHIPLIFALLAIFTEFLAPLALLVGLLTRPAALGLLVVMLVAAIKVHIANGFFMNWGGHQRGEGVEFFILGTGIALALIIGGAGAWSLDALVGKRIRQQQNKPVIEKVATIA
ncbi:hypothetical protein KDW_51810 [Dictyobacter vulcani]|uniref:DoxX family protein n=1 Tax=Dictyobacter vulcani TaxID=2607529 RepID=A0A5J4KXZ4_9CHLR|nr:DoxX family protein [Dictyobacter vulcani]GER91019.1 hypothetical protein KDW_51810 [Dictyobacter vulcani]